MNNPELKTEFFLGTDYWALEDVTKHDESLPILFLIRFNETNSIRYVIIYKYNSNETVHYVSEIGGCVKKETILDFYNRLIKILSSSNQFTCKVSIYQGPSFQVLDALAAYFRTQIIKNNPCPN